MGNPSKNPYSKSDFISYMVCDLPPGGRDQNNFSPFRPPIFFEILCGLLLSSAHPKPWAKSPEEAAWALMQRIMGLGQCDGRFYIGFHIVYWLATSHQEVETKIIFPLFRLFRGNGSWCRISRIQSPSHHIISELKSSPPQAI